LLFIENLDCFGGLCAPVNSGVMPLSHVGGIFLKLVSTTLFLILMAASPAFSLWEQDDKTASDETNYKRVNEFSGYLTVDDYPHEHVQRWLNPVEIATLSAMPTMKRGQTMGAFVELMGCQQNARRVCHAQVNYTIYKPDGSIFATRAVRQKEILWKPPAPRRRLKGLARMHFKFGKDDTAGEYKVKAKVTDLNADISFELQLTFHLR
jgi:hypothetical protein